MFNMQSWKLEVTTNSRTNLKDAKILIERNCSVAVPIHLEDGLNIPYKQIILNCFSGSLCRIMNDKSIQRSPV